MSLVVNTSAADDIDTGFSSVPDPVLGLVAARLPEPLMLVTTTGRVRYVNRMAAELLGRAPEAVTDGLLQEFILNDEHSLLSYLHACARTPHASFYRLCVAREPSAPAYFFIEGFALRSDLLPDAPLICLRQRNAMNQVAPFAALTEKIERLSREYRLSEKRFRAMIENAPIGLALVALDYKWELVNNALCRILGYGKTELQSMTFMDITHPDDVNADLWEAQRLIAGEIESYQMDKRYIRKDGNLVWANLSVSLLRNDKGAPKHFIAQIQDITDRRRAEAAIKDLNRNLIQRAAELEAANAELESFTYTVSHDLRAPVRHISGYCQLALESSATGREDIRPFLESIAKATRKLGTLIDDLLDFSRTNHVEISREIVDLGEVIGAARTACADEDAAPSVEWKIGILPGVYGDRAMLEVAFVNLLANALKFSSGRDVAHIEIEASRNDAEVVVSIRDNGVGFDPRYKDKLFGVFERLHRENEFSGTGIGLATVKRIVERNGGRVWADATLNQGAVFHVALRSSDGQT